MTKQDDQKKRAIEILAQIGNDLRPEIDRLAGAVSEFNPELDGFLTLITPAMPVQVEG